MLYLLCLDTKRRVICCQEISRGSVNEVDTSIAYLTETAIRNKASFVVIAHNHPDGDSTFSREDSYFTEVCVKSLNAVGIQLEDHIVFSDGEYSTFRHAGMRTGFF